MKGLDTGVLLEILEGTPAAKKELRKLRGEELATTEANMLELLLLASKGSPKARASRLAGLVRLRRRLTVLPLGPSGFDRAARVAASGGLPSGTIQAALLSALDAAGCEELLTTDSSLEGGRWRVRTRRFVAQ